MCSCIVVANFLKKSQPQRNTVEHEAQADKMSSLKERRYCYWLAGAQDGWWYDSYVDS